MNKRERERKEKEDGKPESKRDEERKRKRRKRREWGSAPLFIILYRALSYLRVFLPIYLVRKPLPVNIGIISRTTSNIVFIVVFSLLQACVSSD